MDGRYVMEIIIPPPDLRDKFVLGAGKDYTVGATGGEKEVILTIAQIPSHNHDISNHSHII